MPSDEPDQSRLDPKTDPLFGLDESEPSDESPIFKDEDLLEIQTVPEKDRIVGRDEQLSYLGSNLRNLLEGKSAEHVLAWGEPGTGKTLCARHVCSRLEDSSAAYGNPVVSAYYNCDTNSTITSTFQDLAESVNSKADDPENVPFTGLSAKQYRQMKLWPTIEREFPGGFVVVLDEIDKHPEIWDVLYALTRAEEKDGFELPVVVIGISNDIRFRDEIEARVNSTLQPDHRVFGPYSEEQLSLIMQNRADAFHEDVLQDGVISKAAELAAKEHGDARKALRLLYNAGELAEEQGETEVTEAHIEAVDERVEVELFVEVLKDTSLDTKLLLFALARLDRNDEDEKHFRTSEILGVYEEVCADVQEDPKGHNRVLELLNKQALAGTIESKKVKGGSDGYYRSYALLNGPERVREALIQSSEKLQSLMSR